MSSLRPFVVVSGPPASGKTTLALMLARHLQLPLLSKDTIKEALIATLGADDVGESQRLGQASVTVLYALAAASPVGAVCENVFHRGSAVEELRRLPGTVVEVYCRCDRDTTRRRYRRRSGTRLAGHFDSQRSDDELWNENNAEPVAVLASDRGRHHRDRQSQPSRQRHASSPATPTEEHSDTWETV